MAHGLGYCAACGIFPEQGLSLRPLHGQADSLPLILQGSPPLPAESGLWVGGAGGQGQKQEGP